MKWILAALAALTLSIAAALPAAASPTWTGFGAPLSDWTKAHPKHSAGCPAGGCYGGLANVGGSPAIQFVTLSTSGPQHRVDGYTQAIGDGTPLAAAERAVLALLPRDTKTSAFWIDHNDGNGNSCAFWNLNSKTIAGWLPKDYSTKGGNPAIQKLVGPVKPGAIGIELNTVGSNGFVYKANDVSEAVVDTLPNSKSTTC